MHQFSRAPLSDSADRRAHRRVASVDLGDAQIRIPHRPAVSLVDLSSGGALLELPFQLSPQSRMTVELHAPGEQVAVPFRLLRCYVTGLRGGVRYHAAGAFEELLHLPMLAERPAPSGAARLAAALERLRAGG